MSGNSTLDFLMCYEHINREVENLTLLKYELTKRGYTCDIIPYRGPGFCKYSLTKAKVVLTPWLRYNENVFHYLQLAQKPYKIVNLQWEQVYSKKGLESKLTATVDEAKKAVFLCWGKNSQNRFINSGINKDNVKIVGAVHQDFGRAIFREYYMTKEELSAKYKIKSNKKWILYVSSFSMANYPPDALKILIERFGNYISDLHVLNKETQTITLDWIEKLLQVCDCEFIYRPHPSEFVCTRLQELKSKYNNFHVISELSVKQWALVSEQVNLWISTSNAEITSLGKVYHVIRPLKLPDGFDMESYENCDFITDLHSFIRINTLETQNDEIVKKQREQLSRFYDYSEDKPAYVRIADFLEEVISNDRFSAVYSFTLMEKLKFSIKENKIRLISFITELAMKTKYWPYIKYIPFKTHIRDNMIRAIKQHILQDEMVNGLLRYMESHEH